MTPTVKPGSSLALAAPTVGLAAPDLNNVGMALLFLTQHEAKIVLQGRIVDPTWKPAAGSELDRAWDGDDPEASFEEALADRARRSPPFIDVNAASSHWRKTTRRRALLIAKNPEGRQSIVGVGNCATKIRRAWLGTSVVRLSGWRLLSAAVPLEDLVSQLSGSAPRVVLRLFAEEESREMPAVAGKAVWEAMHRLAPDLEDLVSSLPDFPPLARPQPNSLTKTDAALSALRFFSSSWRTLEPVPDPPPPTALASRIESIALRDEDEVITDDTGAFLDWDSDGRANGGWYLFRSPDGERELRVKNINFKGEETATGADLVYVRSDPECVVLVQYKLLTSNSDGARYFFRDAGGRLGRQVKQMLSFSSTQASDPNGDDNYRIGSDIGFVKFVLPAQPGQSSGRLVIPDGRYHPAEGVLRMLAHPDRGPKSGNIHLVEEWRSLDGETFAKLVRDQWVGSAGTVSDELLAILGLARNPLYLAVEESARPVGL